MKHLQQFESFKKIKSWFFPNKEVERSEEEKKWINQATIVVDYIKEHDFPILPIAPKAPFSKNKFQDPDGFYVRRWDIQDEPISSQIDGDLIAFTFRKDKLNVHLPGKTLEFSIDFWWKLNDSWKKQYNKWKLIFWLVQKTAIAPEFLHRNGPTDLFDKSVWQRFNKLNSDYSFFRYPNIVVMNRLIECIEIEGVLEEGSIEKSRSFIETQLVSKGLKCIL